MKTLIRLKSNANKRRRKIVIEEINILRNFEGSHLIQKKISRQLTKLHSLWFKDSLRAISYAEL